MKVTSKGIPKNWTSNPDSINIISMIIKDIYNNRKLKSEIDYELNDNLKINSIKVLRGHYEATVATGEERKYSLRIYKDTIDIYQKRMKIQNKLGMLRERIEWWCEENGYDNMSYQKTLKSRFVIKEMTIVINQISSALRVIRRKVGCRFTAGRT